MIPEAYCAQQLALQEAEIFLAVGDAVGKKLNPNYLKDRREGKADSLPDLLSVKRKEGVSHFRLREVKFKLEEDIARKALSQLTVGVKRLQERMADLILDRVEIAVPLGDRKLKEEEKALLGPPIDENRFPLRLDGANAFLHCGAIDLPVTVILL